MAGLVRYAADARYASSGQQQSVYFNRDALGPAAGGDPDGWTGNRSVCPWGTAPCQWGPTMIEGGLGFNGYLGAAAANFRGALDFARDANEPQGPTSGNRVGYVLWG